VRPLSGLLLCQHFHSGVQDFFYEPAKGIVQSPEEFGKGVARGGLSFLQGTVGSAFTFSSSLLGSVGNLANALGGSDESDIQLFSPTAKQNQSRGKQPWTRLVCCWCWFWCIAQYLANPADLWIW
jgi:hypothetical protein